jgi:hypothetical protein
VRGVVDLNVGVGGVQRIREVVVVEEVPVAADRRVEVVPLVLGEPHAAGVFRITAPSKARQEQVVKQATLVIERAHVESLFEQARTLALIDKRVVDRLAAVGVDEAVAKLKRSLVVIVAIVDAFNGVLGKSTA